MKTLRQEIQQKRRDRFSDNVILDACIIATAILGVLTLYILIYGN